MAANVCYTSRKRENDTEGKAMAGSTEGGAISHGELCSSLKNLTGSCAAIWTCLGLMTPLLSTFPLLDWNICLWDLEHLSHHCILEAYNFLVLQVHVWRRSLPLDGSYRASLIHSLDNSHDEIWDIWWYLLICINSAIWKKSFTCECTINEHVSSCLVKSIRE